MKIDNVELIKSIIDICRNGRPENQQDRDYVKDIIDIYCQCVNYLEELKEALNK